MADASASHAGSPVWMLSPRPPAATPIDSRADESSSTTVSSVGSRLRRQYVRIDVSPRARLSARIATVMDSDSNTNAPPSTTKAQIEATCGPDPSSLWTPSRIEKAPPSVNSKTGTRNDSEVDVHAVTEGVSRMWRTAPQPQPDEQQDLIAGVGDGVEGLRQHRRAAGGRQADALEHGERQVAGQCRQDGSSSLLHGQGRVHRPYRYPV